MYKLILINGDDLEIEAIKIIIDRLNDEINIAGLAKSGRKAIQLDKQLQPDIVILADDISGVSDLEVSKVLKARNKDVVIISLMGCNTNEVTSLNVDGYLLRPIDENELLNILKDKIMSLKTNANKLKEKEFSLLDSVITDEKMLCEKLVDDILESYKLISNHDVKIFKEKVINLLSRIIKVCSNTKPYFAKKVNKHQCIEKLNLQKDVQSVNNIVNDFFKLILKDENDINITQKLIGEKNINKNLEPIFKYIEENYKQKITLEEAASICNLNMYYFSKLFKKDTDIKFIDYVTRYKMEKAKEILRYTDESIVNIAIQLGYDESGYFSKVFKRVVGVTPSLYRNKNT